MERDEATRTFTLRSTSERSYTDLDIAYWVITAFEGGSSYWCDKAVAVERNDKGEWEEITGERYEALRAAGGVAPYANPLFWENGRRGYRMFDPYEEQWCEHVLTMSGIQKALNYQPPQRKGQSNNWYRKVVDRLLSEDYDGGDADALVQVAVLGEVVYG